MGSASKILVYYADFAYFMNCWIELSSIIAQE